MIILKLTYTKVETGRNTRLYESGTLCTDETNQTEEEEDEI
jgi:hypothetical protein